MAGTTTKGFRYPQNADAPNVAVDIQNLATDVDTYLTSGVTLTGTQTLTNKTLTAPIVTTLTLNDSSIVFEGSTGDAYETTLTVTDPTADRTLTLPDSSGTVALTSDIQTLIDAEVAIARMNALMLGGM